MAGIFAGVMAAAAAVLVPNVFDARAAAAAAPQRDLLAHAGERFSDKISPIWVAMIEAPLKEGLPEQTVILAREEIGDKKWHQLPDTPARVIGLTSHGTELVVMLEGKDGSPTGRTWAWFSVDRQSATLRFSYGPPLPPSVRLIALAGDDEMYALGVGSPEIGVATRPAVSGEAGAASTRATAPATTQPAQPSLFMLTGDKWTPLAAEWPKEAAGAAGLASLQVIGDVPHVAVPTGPDEVRIYRFERDPAGWVEAAVVSVEGEPRYVKLLNADERPALWVQTVGNPLGSLWSLRYQVAKVQFAGATPNADEVDVTVASDVRLFFRRDGKPYEQHFNWDGTPTGPAVVLDWTRPRADPSMNLLTTVFMTVLAVLLISTLLRRRAMARDEDRDRGEPEE